MQCKGHCSLDISACFNSFQTHDRSPPIYHWSTFPCMIEIHSCIVGSWNILYCLVCMVKLPGRLRKPTFRFSGNVVWSNVHRCPAWISSFAPWIVVLMMAVTPRGWSTLVSRHFFFFFFLWWLPPWGWEFEVALLLLTIQSSWSVSAGSLVFWHHQTQVS